VNKNFALGVGITIVVVAVVIIAAYQVTKQDGPVLVLKPKKQIIDLATASDVGGYKWVKMGKGNSFVSSDNKCRVGGDIIGYPKLFQVEYLDNMQLKTAASGTVLICKNCTKDKCGTGVCDELMITKVTDEKRFEVKYTKKDGISCAILHKGHFGGRTQVPAEFYETADTGAAYYMTGGSKKVLTSLTMQAEY
jgi:hypothetical protein